MNASAKFTAFVLFAGAALGAAMWTGCTTTSSTNNDTDGGFQPPVTNPPDDGGDGTDDTDGGVDAGPTTCESNQNPNSVFTPPSCQTCLEGKCCSQLQTCFAIVGSETAIDCNDFSDCMADCQGDTACEDDCKLATNDNGVVAAYEAILGCADTSCNSECTE